MELECALIDDRLLQDFFNEYVKLEVFPVPLHYNADTGCICEVGLPRQHDPGVRGSLLDWALRNRWTNFKRSRLYCEYKLSCGLFGDTDRAVSRGQRSRSTVVRPQLSSACFERVLESRDSCVRSESLRPDSCASIRLCESACGQQGIPQPTPQGKSPQETCPRFNEFQCFQSFLRTTTPGGSLCECWVDLELWLIGGRDWSELRTLREKYLTLSSINKYTCVSDSWCVDVQREIIERLSSYWITRFKQRNPSFIWKKAVLQSYDMSCDPSVPFVNGLRCNQTAGRPFQDYLTKSSSPGYVHLVRLWEAIDKILLSQQFIGDQSLLRASWRCWRLFLDQGTVDSHVTTTNKASLLSSLEQNNREGVVKSLFLIQTDGLSIIKRLWTEYLKHDHMTYKMCLGEVPLLADSATLSQTDTPTKLTRKKKKQKQKDSGDLLTSDLKGTPLEPLEDLETLLCFEQYLYMECGPRSQDNLSYQLWRSLFKYDHMIQSKKRDALAVHIHRTFVYCESKRSLQLPEAILELVDVNEDMIRPSSPVLLSLKEVTLQYLECAVNKFLVECRGASPGEETDSVKALPIFESTERPTWNKKHSRASSKNSLRLKNESQHLSLTLSHCEGPPSHQLNSFSEYLERHAPQTVRDMLCNNVKFWMEVAKFKTMFNNETSIRVLYHKGEAIVDRYLDTTSPPWIKITLSSELAVQIVSAVGDLGRVEVPAHLERLQNLLCRAQDAVFTDMVPYWGSFCSQYCPPNGSVLSLPQVVLSGLSSRQPSKTLHLPPLTRSLPHTPLLSFSSMKGLKWKVGLL